MMFLILFVLGGIFSSLASALILPLREILWGSPETALRLVVYLFLWGGLALAFLGLSIEHWGELRTTKDFLTQTFHIFEKPLSQQP